MKKYILSIIAVITLIAAPALAGVWTAQSSSGGVVTVQKVVIWLFSLQLPMALGN